MKITKEASQKKENVFDDAMTLKFSDSSSTLLAILAISHS